MIRAANVPPRSISSRFVKNLKYTYIHLKNIPRISDNHKKKKKEKNFVSFERKKNVGRESISRETKKKKKRKKEKKSPTNISATSFLSRSRYRSSRVRLKKTGVRDASSGQMAFTTASGHIRGYST